MPTTACNQHRHADTCPGDHPLTVGRTRGEQSGGTALLEAPVSRDRDWSFNFPNPVGNEPFDLDDLLHCSVDPEWIELYNATPTHQRRPLKLFHSTPDPDVSFTGYAHFGTEDSAISRAYDTVEPGNEGGMWMLEVEWNGTLSNPTTDTTANFVAHPEQFARHVGVFRNIESECDHYDLDPDTVIDDARDFLDRHPGGALLYFNSIETNYDEAEAISLVARAPENGFTIVSRRLITDEDWERVG